MQTMDSLDALVFPVSDSVSLNLFKVDMGSTECRPTQITHRQTIAATQIYSTDV